MGVQESHKDERGISSRVPPLRSWNVNQQPVQTSTDVGRKPKDSGQADGTVLNLVSQQTAPPATVAVEPASGESNKRPQQKHSTGVEIFLKPPTPELPQPSRILERGIEKGNVVEKHRMPSWKCLPL